VNTLLHGADTICNDEEDKQAEIAIINKTSLIENGYPVHMMRFPQQTLQTQAEIRNTELTCITVLPRID